MMTAKPPYIFDSIERTLAATPREQWSASNDVSKALLNCQRLTGIIRRLMIKRAVKIEWLADIRSEVALIMQMKMLDKLDSHTAVYFVAYRVAMHVIYNWGKKEENTFFSQEISVNECKFDDENEQELMDRLNLEGGLFNDGTESENALDKVLARARLAKKIEAHGWPSDIPRERKKIGRPSVAKE